MTSEWVLEHRDDDSLPMDVLKDEIAKIDGVEIGEGTFTSLILKLVSVSELYMVSRITQKYRAQYGA